MTKLKKALVILLVLAGLYTSLEYLIWTQSAGELGSDVVSAWDQKFAPVKKALPFSSGTVGYLADWDVPGINSSPSDQDAEYILTQYALSPLVVVRGTDFEWIVGSLTTPAYKTWMELHPNEYEVQEFGHQVYLFHRVDAK